MLVHIVADYGVGDLAFAEVVQRIKFYLPDAEPVLTPVPPFWTKSTSGSNATGESGLPSGILKPTPAARPVRQSTPRF